MRRSTEGGEVHGWQGATTENIGNMRGRSNAARRDASPAECRRIYEMSSSLTAFRYRSQAYPGSVVSLVSSIGMPIVK